jgi:hypothetical protein
LPSQFMKLLSRQRKPHVAPEKRLALGELIARTSIVGGEKDAPNMPHQAMEAQLVKFLDHRP